MILQIEVYDNYKSTLQGTVSQKKIRNWNKNLHDIEVRRLCSDHHNELAYLWNSDPDRRSKDVYDTGEVDVLNKKYELDSVKRDMKKNALIREKQANLSFGLTLKENGLTVNEQS